MVFWLTPVISAIALAVVPATSISINFALNFRLTDTSFHACP